MSGSVPAARSESPGWIGWLTLLVCALAGVLLVGLISLANGSGWVFLGMIGIGILIALGLPAWAIWGLDDDAH